MQYMINSGEIDPRAALIVDILTAKGWTISFAESCTAGLAAAHLVDIPSASNVFNASFVTYANEAKMKYLGVDEKTIETFGVVSEEVAGEMARGCAKANEAEVGVGISGVAGPGGGTPETPVGTVWMAARCGERMLTQCRHIPGHRDRVISRATNDALLLLLSLLVDSE